MLTPLAMLVCGLASASAAGFVAPASTLSDTSVSPIDDRPMVVSNARGDSAVAWTDPATGRITVSERPTGGSYGARSIITTLAEQELASVSLTDNGVIYVFYGDRVNGLTTSAVHVATKTIGQLGWSVVDLESSDPTGQHPANVPIMGRVTPSGRGVAVWYERDDGSPSDSKLLYSLKAAGSPTWSAPAALPGGTTGRTPASLDLAVNAAGAAAVVFEAPACGGWVAMGSTMTTGGTWATAGPIETCSTPPEEPHVTVAADGSATAAWARDNGSERIVQYATAAVSGGAFVTAPASGSNDLSDVGWSAGDPEVVAVSDGSVVVAWERNGVLQQRTRTFGASTFAAIVELTTNLTLPTTPMLSASTDGSVAAVWSGKDFQGRNTLGGAHRATGTTSFTPVNDHQLQELKLPRIASDANGTFAVAWVNTGGQYSVQASAIDTVPPSVSNVVFPATATAGVSFSYSATISDQGSTPTGQWGFGDSSSGPVNGSKTYQASGTKIATLTVTDAAGNKTIVTRQIVVAAAAGGGGSEGGGSTTPGGNTPPAGGTPPPTGGTTPRDTTQVSTPPPTVGSTRAVGAVVAKWNSAKTFANAIRFEVSGAAVGSTITVTCTGGKKKGCPFTTREFPVTTTGTQYMISLFNWRKKVRGTWKSVRSRVLVGAVIDVRITRPGYTGTDVRMKIRPYRQPITEVLCVVPDSAPPAPCTS